MSDALVQVSEKDLMHIYDNELTPAIQAAAGGCAAGLASLVFHPLDLVKTRCDLSNVSRGSS